MKLKVVLLLFIVSSLFKFNIVYATENKYVIFNDSMTWIEARDYCISLGGHLVTITSIEEQNTINDLICQEQKPMNLYWIGLSKNDSYEWEWENEDSYIFTNWASGEPNEDFNNTEFYTQIYGMNYNHAFIGEWNDSRNDGGTMEFYLLSNTGFICEFENEILKNGFSSLDDGWPILNTELSFGYKKPYYLDFSNYFKKGINPSFGSMISGLIAPFKEWDGNCFGLSLLAAANYNGQININSYFNNRQGTLNTIGYNKIIYTDSGNLYSIEGNEPLIKLIEKTQASQISKSVLDTELFKKDKDFTNLISYLSSDDANPLVACFPSKNGGHAVVIETSSKPIDHEDGRYSLLCYDCNAPRLSIPLENACEFYNYFPSYITIDSRTNEWWYFYNNEINGNGKYVSIQPGFSFKSLRFFDASKLSEEYFYGKKLSFVNNKNTFYYASSNLEVFNENITWLKVENDMVIYGVDGIDYYPYCGGNIIDQSKLYNEGVIMMPISENRIIAQEDTYIFRTNGETFITYFGNGIGELIVDEKNLRISLKNIDSQKECNYKLTLGKLKTERYIVADGKLGLGEMISLNSEDNNLSTVTSETTSSKDNVHTYILENNKIQEENFHVYITHFNRNVCLIISVFVLFILIIIMVFIIRKWKSKVK